APILEATVLRFRELPTSSRDDGMARLNPSHHHRTPGASPAPEVRSHAGIDPPVPGHRRKVREQSLASEGLREYDSRRSDSHYRVIIAFLSAEARPCSSFSE